jgi:hypothetical protein
MRGGGTHVPNRRLGTDGKRVDQLLPLQKHMHPLLALKLRLRCHCTFAVALSCSGLVVAAKMGKSKKSKRDKPDKNSKSRDRTVEIVCYKVCKTKAKPGEKAAWERFRQGGKFTVKAHSGSNFQELAVEIRKGLQIGDQAVFHDARLAGIDVHSDRLVLAAAAAAEAATPQVGLVDAPSGMKATAATVLILILTTAAPIATVMMTPSCLAHRFATLQQPHSDTYPTRREVHRLMLSC